MERKVARQEKHSTPEKIWEGLVMGPMHQSVVCPFICCSVLFWTETKATVRVCMAAYDDT